MKKLILLVIVIGALAAIAVFAGFSGRTIIACLFAYGAVTLLLLAVNHGIHAANRAYDARYGLDNHGCYEMEQERD